MLEKVTTKDGSTTLFSYHVNEAYRSLNGAAAESHYVFVECGLLKRFTGEDRLSVLEIGFGTGLNCLQSVCQQLPCRIDYYSLDILPVPREMLDQMHFVDISPQAVELYEKIKAAPWGTLTPINDLFRLCKQEISIIDFTSAEKFDVIYFDPFAPRSQPDSWRREVFENVFKLTNPQGVLVTYSSKGDVRRLLTDVGFKVERLPGPPGKRHMVRAIKP